MSLTPLQRLLSRYITRRLGPPLISHRHSSTAAHPPSTPDSLPPVYDVAVLGGGPAGLSLLNALRSNPATSSLRLALIEAQDLSKTHDWSLPDDVFSNRVSSLTPKSVAFLKKIGAWRYVRRERVQKYGRMSVWDGVSGAKIEFGDEGAEVGEERGLSPHSRDSGEVDDEAAAQQALDDFLADEDDEAPSTSTQPDAEPDEPPDPKTIAYMTENLNLTCALLHRLSALGSIDTFSSSPLSSIAYGPNTATTDFTGWPLLTLSSGQRLLARLLIGADGASSPVREFAHIPSNGWDYGQHGVVATVQLNTDTGGPDVLKTAYQRFLPTGPIALLPLPGSLSTLVWSIATPHAAVLKSLTPPQFVALVNAGFRLSPADLTYLFNTLPLTPSADFEDEVSWRLPHSPPVGENVVPHILSSVQEGSVASFPLRLRHASQYTTSRIALVGDAAHSMHPLAGQGLNMGQGDVEVLVEVIADGVGVGADIGNSMVLEEYDGRRYAANERMLGVVDKLNKLYATEFAPVVAVRSLGLGIVERMGWLKGAIMRQAAGVS